MMFPVKYPIVINSPPDGSNDVVSILNIVLTQLTGKHVPFLSFCNLCYSVPVHKW
ncbi:MAG: hypothetical protein J7L07_00090 [Candidatus Odinarchaeota archaeon]|nr:hypothetical protein [Candidatus Odinarchaeota archaeon]